MFIYKMNYNLLEGFYYINRCPLFLFTYNLNLKHNNTMFIYK